MFFFFFFFNDTATTEIYTLSLHDALPIWGRRDRARLRRHGRPDRRGPEGDRRPRHRRRRRRGEVRRGSGGHGSSDEQGRRSRVAVAEDVHGGAGTHGAGAGYAKISVVVSSTSGKA